MSGKPGAGHEELTEAQATSARQTADNERVLARLEGRAESTAEEIDALADTIRGFGSAQFDLRDANRQVEQSIDDLNDSLAENGYTFDRSTQAGRDNEAAVDDLAKSYLDQAAAVGIQQGSLEAALPVLEAGRQAFIDQMVAAGGDREEVERLADELGLLPDNVRMLIEANTSPAQSEIDSFVARNDGRRVRIYADGTVSFGNAGQPRAIASGGMFLSGAPVQAFASGGFPSGVYPYRQGGIHKFAEAGPEAYISFREQDRQRNVGIWREAGAMLGVWGHAPQSAEPSVQDNRSYSISVPPAADPTYQANEIVRALRWS